MLQTRAIIRNFCSLTQFLLETAQTMHSAVYFVEQGSTVPCSTVTDSFKMILDMNQLRKTANVEHTGICGNIMNHMQQ